MTTPVTTDTIPSPRTWPWLQPLAWLYGCGVALRNTLFSLRVLRSRAFPVPVICVGNVTVGGTGKTPHVELLVRLLARDRRVAVVSRGYKRQSSGFVLADSSSTAATIGDEPLQIKRKFGHVTVAVDGDRCRAIDRLLDRPQPPQLIVLDDAFQHRYVKPSTAILLVDWHRLITRDRLLPAGRLREQASARRRADAVIVTKCPATLSDAQRRQIARELSLDSRQKLFFTTLAYDALQPVFPREAGQPPVSLSGIHVLLLTAIAAPAPLQAFVSSQTGGAPATIAFADHHTFSPSDVERINTSFRSLPQPRLVVTTEKDAQRLLLAEGLSDELRHRLYALPIRVAFFSEEEEAQFRRWIAHEADGVGIARV